MLNITVSFLLKFLAGFAKYTSRPALKKTRHSPWLLVVETVSQPRSVPYNVFSGTLIVGLLILKTLVVSALAEVIWNGDTKHERQAAKDNALIVDKRIRISSRILSGL